MELLFYLYVGGGALLVPPNPIYGFRTPATLCDPSLWYAVNRYSGKWLLGCGLGAIIAAVGLRLVPGLSVDSYALLFLAIFIILFGLAIWRSLRYLQSLKPRS